MPDLESVILPRFPQKQKRGDFRFSGSLYSGRLPENRTPTKCKA
ncbi:hypothetical protein EIKCOROL_02562 [Eikenella corrodens ATCC 23834]|uniref:Uncharacterized protein n=1 Tax=Eikenella corrodens ATCC 23834 TaxID=546274 RepID=C0DYU6_EIKCO|nr:hypothetical protein EIKCOROL_02562 [Eikenella corrodens ATCC 23834]